MQYHFYAYHSPYGIEYGGNGMPHRFQNRRDRDNWMNECPDKRWVMSREQFNRRSKRFGWYVEHDNGDLNGFQADIDDLEEE